MCPRAAQSMPPTKVPHPIAKLFASAAAVLGCSRHVRRCRRERRRTCSRRRSGDPSCIRRRREIRHARHRPQMMRPSTRRAPSTMASTKIFPNLYGRRSIGPSCTGAWPPSFNISDEAQVAHSGILAVAKAAVWVLLNPPRTPSLYATSVTHYREVCSYRAWLGRDWN